MVKKKSKKNLLFILLIFASFILGFAIAFVLRYSQYIDYGRVFSFESETLMNFIFDAEFLVPFIGIFGILTITIIIIFAVKAVAKKVNENTSEEINLF